MSLFTNEDGELRWYSWVLGLGSLAMAVGTCVYYLPDYGQCLKGHSEPRHQNAWVEIRTVESCWGPVSHQSCTSSAYPIFHPAEDWTVWVCEQWEFPDGDGREQRKLRKER